MSLIKSKCKYIKKKVIRHINDNFSDFSSDNDSDDSDEEWLFSFDERAKNICFANFYLF